MNQQKFDALFRGISEQAKKVYDCVPIADAWKPAQIMTDLHRKNISMNDYRVVMGCINTMIDAGLIVEGPKGHFKREGIKPKQADEIDLHSRVKTNKEASMTKPTPAKPGPLDLLGDFASRLRALANDAESIALAIASQTETNDAETAKLRQLQALLKSIGS